MRKNGNQKVKDAKGTVKWLLKMSKPQWFFIIIIIIADVLQSLSVAAVAVATRGFINSAAVTHDKDGMISNGIALLIIVFAVFFLRILENSLELRVEAKLTILFRTSLFSNILKKDYASISTFHSGELLNRLTSDVQYVAEGLTTILPNVSGLVTRIISVFITLFVLMPKFAIIFASIGIVCYLIARVFRSIMKTLHKAMLESDGKVRSFMQEAISNILAIKVFVKEDNVVDHSLELQENNYRIKMKRRTYTILAAAGFSLIFQAGYFGALAWGGVSLFTGALDYGTFTALLQLVSNLQSPFLSLSGVLPKYYAVLASAERLMEIENLDNEPLELDGMLDRDKLYEEMNSIKFDNISFSYGREKVLNKTSFELKKNDFVCIMGISGIGKSTLLKLLLGVYPAYDGKIYVKTDKEDITVGKSTRLLFSYVPQGNMLFSGTLRENITFAANDATESEIEEAVRISCISDFLSDLPEGLDTVLGEEGKGLSEGQIQRVAIARAILNKAPIILLDEATSALDEMTERAVLSNLKELKNKTLVIISHKKAALEICNVNVKIENKKIESERKN